MSDRKTMLADESWANAAYELISIGLSTPLAVDIRIANSGLDLPDAALDNLCDAIMGDVCHTLAASEAHGRRSVTP